MTDKQRLAHMRKMQRLSRTPAARKKALATRARNRALKLKQLPATATPLNGATHASSELPDHLLGYAFGHVEAWLQIYAASQRVPATALAHRVGALLQGSRRR